MAKGRKGLESITLGELQERICAPVVDCGGGTSILVAASMGTSLAYMALKMTLRHHPELWKGWSERGDRLYAAAQRFLELAHLENASQEGLRSLGEREVEKGPEEREWQQARSRAWREGVQIAMVSAQLCADMLRIMEELTLCAERESYFHLLSGANLVWGGLSGLLYALRQYLRSCSKEPAWSQDVEELERWGRRWHRLIGGRMEAAL